MANNDRHQTNLGLLDSIIGIAGGVTKETRRLSFRMEQATKGEGAEQNRGDPEPSGSGPVPGDGREEEEYSSSTEVKRGMGRTNPKQIRKPNPT